MVEHSYDDDDFGTPSGQLRVNDDLTKRRKASSIVLPSSDRIVCKVVEFAIAPDYKRCLGRGTICTAANATQDALVQNLVERPEQTISERINTENFL